MPKNPNPTTPPQPTEKPSPWRTAETFRAHIEEMRAEAAATGADQVVHEHLGGTDGALTLRVYPSGVATWFLRYHLGGKHRYWIRSAIDARSLFRRHVAGNKTLGHLAELPANQLKPEQVAALLRALTKAKKRDTARKLRAYLHAAYKMACRAALDPDAPEQAHGFDITRNPVSDVPFASASKARRRVLSEAEVRAFLLPLRAADTADTEDEVSRREVRGTRLCRQAVLLSLLLGGQRPGQVLRLTTGDVVDGVVTLYDPKGRRAEPRVHQLPLIGETADIVGTLMADAARVERLAAAPIYLFSTRNDRSAPMRMETLSNWARPIIERLVACKDVPAPFQLRDLRRTAETMLAAEGVSKDDRAQIQAHGLGGVQDKHYDRHDYLPAKRQALIRWHSRLKAIEEGRPTREPGEVVDLSAARGELRSAEAA
jgi:integrase